MKIGLYVIYNPIKDVVSRKYWPSIGPIKSHIRRELQSILPAYHDKPGSHYFDGKIFYGTQYGWKYRKAILMKFEANDKDRALREDLQIKDLLKTMDYKGVPGATLFDKLEEFYGKGWFEC